MSTLSLFDALPDPLLIPPRPLGATFDEALDGKRLARQFGLVFNLMRDGRWRTLSEIGRATSEPEASISARLRDARRLGHTVERRRRGDGRRGLWEYRLEEKR